MDKDILNALNSARKTVAENNYVSDSIKRVEKTLDPTAIQDINTIYGSTNPNHLDFGSGENDRIAARQEAKAKAQGKWAQLRNSVFQGLYNEALVGTVASIWDLAVADYEAMMAVNPLFAPFSENNVYRSDDWKKVVQSRLKVVLDNTVANKLNEHQNYIREDFAPIYRNEQTPLAFGEWAWYMENLPNAVSTLTLLLPAAGEAKLAGYLGKGARMAINVAKGVKATSGLRKGFGISRATAGALARSSSALGERVLESGFGQTGLGLKLGTALETVGVRPATLAKALRGLEETGIQAFTSRTLEGIQESREVYNQVKEDMKQTLSSMNDTQKTNFRKNNTKNGKYIFEGMNDDQIADQIALESANKTFIDDYQALIFDVAQFYALRKFIKPITSAPLTRSVYNAQQRSLARLSGTEAAEKTWLQWQGYKLKNAFGSPMNFAKSAWTSMEAASISEMPEEMIQGINTEKGKEVAKHYLNPSYVDRTYASYLSDPAIWDQGVWGMLGGMIFNYGGRALSHAAKRGNAEIQKRLGLITEDAYNALLMTNDKARIKNIEGRGELLDEYINKMNLIDGGRNPYKRYVNEYGEQYFDEDGNAFEYAQETEREALRLKATEEYVTKLALDAYETGNATLIKEYLNNEDFHKLIESKGVKFSNDEIKVGDFIKDTVNNIFETYEQKLVDVIENTDVDSDVIARMVARDLTLLNNRKENNSYLLNYYTDDVTNDNYNTAQPTTAQQYVDNYRKRYGLNRLKQLINTKEYFRLWKDEGRISDQRMAEIEEKAKRGEITSERLEMYRQIHQNQLQFEATGHSTELSVAGYNSYIKDINKEINAITKYLTSHGLLKYTYKNDENEETTIDYLNADIGDLQDIAYGKTYSEELNSLPKEVKKIFDIVTNDDMFGDVTDKFKKKVARMVTSEIEGAQYDNETPTTKQDYKDLYDKYAYTLERYTSNLMGGYTRDLMEYLQDSKTIEELENRWNRILSGQVNEDLEDAVDALRIGYLNLLQNGRGNFFSDMVNSAYMGRKNELIGEKNNNEERENIETRNGTKRRVEKTDEKEKAKESKKPKETEKPKPKPKKEEKKPIIDPIPEEEGDGIIALPNKKDEKPKDKEKPKNEGYNGEEEYDPVLVAGSIIESAVDDVLDENKELVKKLGDEIDLNSEEYKELFDKVKVAIENSGMNYDPKMDSIIHSAISLAKDLMKDENPDDIAEGIMGSIGFSKIINMEETSVDERIEKFLEAYLKTIAEVDYNGKRVVNVYKLMQMLLNDRNVSFDIALTIIKNLQDYIKSQDKYVFIGINNEFTNNPRSYLRKLAQVKGEATIVNGLRINRTNVGTLSRMGYDTEEKRIEYYKLRNRLLLDLNNSNAESEPKIKMEQNGDKSNSVRFIIEYKDKKGNKQSLEIGYIAAPTRTNNNKTYSISSTNTGFNYSITNEGEGVFTANVDEFFNALIFESSDEANELRQICRNYAFRIRERIKSGISQYRFVALEEEEAKKLLDNKLIKQLKEKGLITVSNRDNVKTTIQGKTVSGEVNEASRIIQIITDVLYKTDEDSADTWKTDDAAADYILTATPDEIKTSYEKWKYRIWDQYDRSYQVIEKFNRNQKQNFSTNMINQVILHVNTSDELTNVNDVVSNNPKNKLVYMDADGSIIDENGNRLGVSSRINELAILIDTGSYVQANGYEPCMVFVNKKNKIGTEGRLYSKLKEELTNIIKSQFSDEDKSPNFDEIKRKLNSLFGVKGLFSGYQVIDFTTNGSRMIALATTGEDSTNILTFYENANNNGRTGVSYNPFGTKFNFIHSADKTLIAGGSEINAVDLIVSSIMNGDILGHTISTGVLFNTSFALVKKDSYNEYIERKDGNIYIMGEKYNSALDFVMKEKAFATHAKKNKDGSLIYGTPEFKTLYLDVDDDSKTREQEAISGINIKIPKPNEKVNTLEFLKQLGFREDYIKELMGYSNEDGKTTLPLIPEEFIFSGVTNRVKNKENPLLGDFEGVFNHETGEIRISSLSALGTIFGQSRNARNNLVRVLLHEQLHKALSAKGFAGRQRLFSKNDSSAKEIVDELLKIAKFAYDKVSDDIINGNNVGGLNKDALTKIKNYLENVVNKTGVYKDKDDFYIAEEFIVESMTRTALLKYFNNTEYGNVTIDNIEDSKKTIWQRIFDNLLKILNRLGLNIGSIKNNTILARQYEIFGETFNKEVQEAEIRGNEKGTKQNNFEKTGKIIEEKEKELNETFKGLQQGENEEDWEKNHIYIYVDPNEVHHKIDISVTRLTNTKSDGSKTEYTGPEVAGPIGTELDEYFRLYFDANAIDPDNVVTEFENNGSLKYLDKLTDAQREAYNEITENIRQQILDKFNLRGKRFKIITGQTTVAGTVDINDKGSLNGKRPVAGTMDMIILTEDGYYILDFKTSRNFDGSKQSIQEFPNTHPQYGKQVDLYSKFIDANTDKLGKCLGKALIVVGVKYGDNLKYNKDTRRIESEEEIPFTLTGGYAVIDVSDEKYGVNYEITNFVDTLIDDKGIDFNDEDENNDNVDKTKKTDNTDNTNTGENLDSPVEGENEKAGEFIVFTEDGEEIDEDFDIEDDFEDISESKFIDLDEVSTSEEVQSIFYDYSNEVVISNVEQFSSENEFLKSVDVEQRPELASLMARGFVKFVC